MAEAHKIVVAEEGDSRLFGADRERDPEPAPEIFFQPGWTRKALGAVDDLGKAAMTGIHAAPHLSVAGAIFGNGCNRRDAGVIGQWQGRTDAAT